MPRALLSVYDKTGLVDLGRGLKALGWDLLATGGTFKSLVDAGLEVMEVADYTGAPECFEGRVKTLHPKIHGGLLFRRDSTQHKVDAKRLDIAPIDLVVVNLYPFETTISRAGVTPEECIEQIDIGGPSMLRSAAKNHTAVTVLTDPHQYAGFIEKLREGSWSMTDQRACALAAFKQTAAYDLAISKWMQTQYEPGGEELPETLDFRLSKRQALRYGENPHQAAAFYVEQGASLEGISACEQLQGKELSFNNLLDSDAGVGLVWQFQAPGCVIVKHNNPCGAAVAAHPIDAFLKAQAGDPLSSFGGIVAFNRAIGVEVAQAMAQSFWEVILAPGFTQEALQVFATKKQLRIMKTPSQWPSSGLDLRTIGGGFLVQRSDDQFSEFEQWEVKVTGRGSKPVQEDLVLAQKLAKAVKSNAIVLVKNGAAVGIGAGQMSRVDSVEIACRKAGNRAKDAVLGSDAFFPFPDGLELAAAHGVHSFVEPGGSLRDADVIASAQRLGVWLFFSGMRHFRH